jgi:hypothetical protein
MTQNKNEMVEFMETIVAFVDSPEARESLGGDFCDAVKMMVVSGVFFGAVLALVEITRPKRKVRPVVPPRPRFVAGPLVVRRRKPLLLPPASSTWESDEIRRARALLGVSSDATIDQIQEAFTAKAKVLAAIGTDPMPLFHAACLLIVVIGSKAAPSHAA